MLLPDVGDALVFLSLGGASSVRLVFFDVGDEVLKLGGCIHARLFGFLLLLPLRNIFLVKHIVVINMVYIELKLVLFSDDDIYISHNIVDTLSKYFDVVFFIINFSVDCVHALAGYGIYFTPLSTKILEVLG